MDLSIAPYLDLSWQVVSLFFGTFVQEDAAIFAAAYKKFVDEFNQD